MKITRLTRDEQAITEGIWVKPDPAEDIEFHARGYTQRYNQRREKQVRNFVSTYGALSAVPHAIRAKQFANILFEECIIGVRGVVDENDQPVTLQQYWDLCRTPEGEPALEMAYNAVERVSQRRAADAEEAAGNSGPSSNGSTSTGGA